jgi:hypothetical protein
MPSLWDYVQEYPERLRDQFTQGMQQFAETRNPVAALSALNPTTPFIQDAALQGGGLIAPHANQLGQAVSQGSENLGLGPLAIPEVTDEQLAPLLMLGMGNPSKMGFFSPSGKALTTAPGKGTSQQYLAHLKKEPGATKEAKQTGLIQKLEEAPGTLTKEEVVSMWNPIELTETVKGDLSSAREVNLDSPYAIPEVLNIANMATNTPGDLEMTLVNNPDAYYALEANFPELLENEDWGEIVVNSVFGGDSKPSDLVKYGNEANLNLPGGEEPKEILVQLPEREKSPYELVHRASGEVKGVFPNRDAAVEAFQEYRQRGEGTHYQIGPQRSSPDYESTHWDEPNILAHIRTNKRDVGGVSALHAEEFQSDWHQAGQKKGYGTPLSGKDRVMLELQKQGIEHRLVDTTNIEDHDRLSSELKHIEEKLRNANLNRGKVPDAPYKKDWHELSFKRFLMEGINDPSVDRITWTSGAVQADRYNLAKYIDSIDSALQKDGRFSLGVKYKEGNVENLTNIEPEKLADYVGKEMAEKIVKDSTKREEPEFKAVIKELLAAGLSKSEAQIVWDYAGLPVDDLSLEEVERVGPVMKKLNRLRKEANAAQQQDTVYPFESYTDLLVSRKGRPSHTYSGLDLQVGGEFHKQLYDKKIPQFAKKFLKKYGVEPQKFDGSESAEVQRLREELKVVAKNFPNMSPEELIRASEIREAIQNKSDNNKYWYIDITPEMRQDLQEKGVPLAMNDRKPLLAYA